MIIQLSNNIRFIRVCVQTESENYPRADGPGGMADTLSLFADDLTRFLKDNISLVNFLKLKGNLFRPEDQPR